MRRLSKPAIMMTAVLSLAGCISTQALFEETLDTINGRGSYAHKTTVETIVVTTGLVRKATDEYLEGLSVAYAALDLKEKGVQRKLRDLRQIVAESRGFSAAARESVQVLRESDLYARQLEAKIRATRIDELSPAARAKLVKAGEQFELANYLQTKASVGAVNLGYRLANKDIRHEVLASLSRGRIVENMDTLMSFPGTVFEWSSNIGRSQDIVAVMRETEDFEEALAAKREVVNRRGAQIVAAEMANDDPFQ